MECHGDGVNLLDEGSKVMGRQYFRCDGTSLSQHFAVIEVSVTGQKSFGSGSQLPGP